MGKKTHFESFGMVACPHVTKNEMMLVGLHQNLVKKKKKNLVTMICNSETISLVNSNIDLLRTFVPEQLQ